MEALTRENPIRPVLVEWVDSVRDALGWDSLDSYLDVEHYHRAQVQTVGLLVGSNDDLIVVALSAQRDLWREDVHLADAIVIPRRAIDRMQTLSWDGIEDANRRVVAVSG
jgi:hypothetical protein